MTESPDAAIAALRAESKGHSDTLIDIRLNMATKEGQLHQSELIKGLRDSLAQEIIARRENDAELRVELRDRDKLTNERITNKIEQDEAREEERAKEQDRRRYGIYTAIALALLSPLITIVIAAMRVGSGG